MAIWAGLTHHTVINNSNLLLCTCLTRHSVQDFCMHLTGHSKLFFHIYSISTISLCACTDMVGEWVSVWYFHIWRQVGTDDPNAGLQACSQTLYPQSHFLRLLFTFQMRTPVPGTQFMHLQSHLRAGTAQREVHSAASVGPRAFKCFQRRSLLSPVYSVLLQTFQCTEVELSLKS